MKLQLASSFFENCFYSKYGEGYPIFLIHGFSEDGRVWDKILKQMMDTFCVIVPDLPGSGNSAMLSAGISVELMASYILAIMDQEGISKTILFGHSMGGYAALAFAEAYPDRLDALSLVHSTAFADDLEKVTVRKKAIQLIESGGKTAFLQTMIPNLYSEDSVSRHKHLIKEHLTMAEHISSESLVHYYKAMIQRKDRTDVLRNTKLPIQFVIGTEDKAIPSAQSLKECHLPERVMVNMINGVGHMVMQEQVEKCTDILNSFCRYVCEGKKALNL